MTHYDQAYADMMEHQLMLEMLYPEQNPSDPRGGRAALGTAAGLGVAALAASAWARFEQKTWNPNDLVTRDRRLWIAAMLFAGGAIGAAVGARTGTRGRAVVGSAVGTVIAQLPVIWNPSLIRNNPIVGNIWQFGLPLAGAVVAANLD